MTEGKIYHGYVLKFNKKLMILCPLQNYGQKDGKDWGQIRPPINQKFGQNPQTYAQFGMKGHNGIDLKADQGTLLFTPFEGTVEVKDDADKGYVLHIIVRKKMSDGDRKGETLECVLGHLSKVDVKTGDYVYLGQKIGLTGNTGFSTGPHLHLGLRYLDTHGTVKDYDNGFKGYFDCVDLIITWKGGLTNSNL